MLPFGLTAACGALGDLARNLTIEGVSAAGDFKPHEYFQRILFPRNVFAFFRFWYFYRISMDIMPVFAVHGKI
ncbi:MAG: hypothetical protein IJ181_08860 [Acidaminococcaceae bacterium]|nr:hypothetical protein [Acidaminococcaceae bacterium]